MKLNLILKQRIVLSLILFLSIMTAFSLILFDISNPYNNFITLFFIFAIAYLLSIRQFLNRNPTPLLISLIGFPNSGKTVYLTSLFNELMTKNDSAIKFLPYGTETIEKVETDINILMNNNWLEKTKPFELFHYYAKASVEEGFFKQKFKIDITDFPGEYFHEFEQNIKQNSLHKSKYFNLAIQSEVILFSIDTAVIKDAKRNGNISIIRDMESKFIIALQVLLDNKGVEIGKKLKAPIAMVFMKCDIIHEDSWEEISENFPRFISFCRQNCSNFKIFYTSSVGELKNGIPRSPLRPFGVVDPIIWALKRV